MLGTVGVAGITAPVLAACGTGTSTKAGGTPVRVGLLVPQSGVDKSIGDDLTNGFKLYLALAGNVLAGHPVTVATADEGDGGAGAKAAVDRLMKQGGVQVITGVAGAHTMTAVRDQIEAARVPLLGSNGSPPQLGDPKYIWQTSYVDDEPGRALGRYLADKSAGSGQVFVVSDDSPSAQDEVDGFVTAYQGTADRFTLAAGPVVVPLFSSPAADLGPVMEAIRSSGAQTVFAYVAGSGAVAFVKALRSALPGVGLYAPGFMTETDLLTQQGEAAKGVYTSLNYSPDLDNDANRTFSAEYRKAYSTTPSTYAMASYDAAAVLEYALELTGGGADSRSINTAISGIGQVDSPRGSWQFNEKHTPLQKWYLRQVRLDGPVLSNVVLSNLATLS